MAVTNANAGTSTGSTSISSLTLTSFNASTADFIFLGVSQWRASDLAPTATFNASQNFVVHASQTMADGAGVRRVTIFKLVAPTQTSANIVVSWVGGVDEAVIGATAWVGVNQTTPLGTAVSTTFTGVSSPVNISTNVTAVFGDVAHDCYSGSADSGISTTTNQTQRWCQQAATNTTEGGGSSAAGTGSPITMTWNDVGHGGTPSNVHIVQVAVPIQAASPTLSQDPVRGHRPAPFSPSSATLRGF